MVCHGRVSHRHGPVFSPVFCFQNMEPHIQVSFCFIAHSQNSTNYQILGFVIQIYQILGFAGVLRAILGAVMCIYMRWCSGYENGLVCLWDAARMQPMFSHIQKMSIMVIVWPLGSKTRQTSRTRRDSENWVVLGHTPKWPKIIDRRTVQVVVFWCFLCVFVASTLWTARPL